MVIMVIMVIKKLSRHDFSFLKIPVEMSGVVFLGIAIQFHCNTNFIAIQFIAMILLPRCFIWGFSILQNGFGNVKIITIITIITIREIST